MWILRISEEVAKREWLQRRLQAEQDSQDALGRVDNKLVLKQGTSGQQVRRRGSGNEETEEEKKQPTIGVEELGHSIVQTRAVW